MKLTTLSSFFALTLLVSATCAHAAPYDMSGKWRVDTNLSASVYHWDFAQSAGVLSGTIAWDSFTQPTTGTIDEGTGAFTIDVSSQAPECGTDTLVGNVAADSLTFAATYTVHGYVWVPGFEPHGGHFECGASGIPYSMDGTRCGNGELEGAEECDSTDCCASNCTLVDSGSTCTDDGNPCTDDACDGAGACLHPDNSVPCSEGEGCASGNCSGGSCLVSSVEAAGTPCDLDASLCTTDTCDGAGQCQGGGPLDCEPCGICSSVNGCVASLDGCDVYPDQVSISLKAGEGDAKRLRIQFKEGLDMGDVGDPSDATTYTICLYERSPTGPEHVTMSSIVLEPAGLCGGVPCWKSQRNGFAYKNGSLDVGGISSFQVDVRKGFKIVGKGSNLPLPSAFSDNTTQLTPKIVASDGVSSACWYHEVEGVQSADKFKGRFDAPN